MWHFKNIFYYINTELKGRRLFRPRHQTESSSSPFSPIFPLAVLDFEVIYFPPLLNVLIRIRLCFLLLFSCLMPISGVSCPISPPLSCLLSWSNHVYKNRSYLVVFSCICGNESNIFLFLCWWPSIDRKMLGVARRKLGFGLLSTTVQIFVLYPSLSGSAVSGCSIADVISFPFLHYCRGFCLLDLFCPRSSRLQRKR